MNIHKITRDHAKGKSEVLPGKPAEEYDHYIAIDWSSKIMAIARLTRHQQHPVVIERPADLKELKLYLQSLQGKKILTVEETTSAHWLYLELRGVVDRIIICDPYRNRLLTDGAKTDRIDAAKLCLLLRGGLLKEVFHRDDELYQLRHLVSSYEDVVKAGVRALNQKSALLRAIGSSDQLKDTTIVFILEKVEKHIALYEEIKAAYEKRFDVLCRQNRSLKALLVLAGIGPIGAVKILVTVIDARRFVNDRHYLSYCGLVKLQKISGQRSYGVRSPRYSRRLKAVYKTATSAALTGRNPFRDYYDYLISKGTAEHNARHAVARYIARVSYGMLKHGTSYEPYRWRKIETKQKP